jgi:SAM-dependent methyltransferase
MIEPLGRAVGHALAGYHHRRIQLPRARRVAAALAEVLADGSQVRSLLDVGAGDGRIAAEVGRTLGAERIVGVEVKPREHADIEVVAYDGVTLPFADDSFDAVLLSDVLHHASDPRALLAEALRVARGAVAVKDHLRFGAWSNMLLLFMDSVGNAASEVEVTGRYFEPAEWVDMVGAAGGRVARLRWPLRIHDLPWRLVTRSALQFAARIEPLRLEGR